MSFDINTNVASLQAQNYLRSSSSFQNKTIQRVTSGLRIVNSGDDAAGLAVANSYRSDEAVLTQGVRNAADGLNQLQIADGGLNNISQLLDRARTLATQSASDTFTGKRDVLNSEFQSVVGEINRQAQAIGLNTGGQFAQNLSVFIGGGRASNGISENTNGSVSLDLAQATVDAKSLGLQGVQASGVAGTDIGTSSSTSVGKILTNLTNTGTESQAGYTTFYVSGPGFSGSNKVALSVNLNGVTDANTLVTAINNAVTATGTGNSQYATAFKNANITAALNVDSAKHTQLTFGSSNAAFQIQAGDQVSNALLGNFSSGEVGKSLTETVTAGTVTTAGPLTSNVLVHIQGSGLAQPVDITLNAAQDTTVDLALADLSSQVTNNVALQAAGISYTGATVGGTAISFKNNRGEAFDVSAVGDLTNVLGLGSYAASNTTTPIYNSSSITATSAATIGGTTTDSLEFSVAGGAGVSLNVVSAATDTAQTLADQLNGQIQANSTLQSAGIHATVSGGSITLTSSNGTNFRVTDVAAAANQFLGFGGDGTGTFTNGANSSLSSVATAAGNNSFFDAGGATTTDTVDNLGVSHALTFNAIKYGSDTQTLNFSAVDSSGSAHPVAVSLTAGNASSLDQAISTINTALQKTNDTTLQQITAVKEYDPTAHTYGINFVSTLTNFSVGIGQVGDGTTEGVGSAASQGVQGTVVNAAAVGTGSTVDISNVASAKAAVTALGAAVTQLGLAQAVVGRGENQFTYAVNLAQSQLTNTQTAEAGVRDADLAAEAANLTKAQILIQAGVAALAQANSAPQQVLSLLRA